MTHKDLLTSLTHEQRAQLTQRTNRHGLWQLSGHFGLIALCEICIALKVPWWPLLLLPLGILMVFLFTLLHETIHRTAFRNRQINDLVAGFCGWLLFLPPRWFRYFHFEHHRYTQNPARDPELLAAKPQTTAAYVWHISGLPLAYSQLKTLWINASGRCHDAYVSAKGIAGVRNESRIMLGSYMALFIVFAVAGLFDLLVYGWFLPLLLGQPFLRLYLMAEHGRCGFVTNMFANTRTVFTSALIRRLAWNMPYHAEHHAYPSVPFHRLPEFHQMVKNCLLVTSDGYIEFHRETLLSYTKRPAAGSEVDH